MEKLGKGPSLAALLAMLAVTCAVAYADSDIPPPRSARLYRRMGGAATASAVVPSSKKLTQGQARVVVKQYLGQHRQARSLGAAGLVAKALEAYPCPPCPLAVVTARSVAGWPVQQ